MAHDGADDFLSIGLAAAQRQGDSTNARIMSAQNRFDRVAIELPRQRQGVGDQIGIGVARDRQFARAIAKMEGITLSR